MTFLPMSFDDEPATAAEASAAHVELLALIALAAERKAAVAGEIDPEPVSDQEMRHFVSGTSNDLAKLLQLAQLRHMATVDRTDEFAMVSWLVRGAEVTIRNQSYPEMVEATNIALLDGPMRCSASTRRPSPPSPDARTEQRSRTPSYEPPIQSRGANMCLTWFLVAIRT